MIFLKKKHGIPLTNPYLNLTFFFTKLPSLNSLLLGKKGQLGGGRVRVRSDTLDSLKYKNV